jgi:hypothetical protein
MIVCVLPVEGCTLRGGGAVPSGMAGVNCGTAATLPFLSFALCLNHSDAGQACAPARISCQQQTPTQALHGRLPADPQALTGRFPSQTLGTERGVAAVCCDGCRLR